MIGVILGFVGFIISLAMMPGVFVRPDGAGTNKFQLGGFWDYLKAPFQRGSASFRAVWAVPKNVILPLSKRPRLWSMNWVIWTSVGALVGLILSKNIKGLSSTQF